MACKYISEFTRSRCSDTVDLSQHPKGFGEKERSRLEERRKRVRGYEVVPGHEEPHKLCGSMKAQQDSMGPGAGKDSVCISHNVMMSIYPGVCKIYPPCCWDDLHYPCISVCMYRET